MAEYVLMPKLGFNMDAGQIVAWRKKEGEAVKRGEVLFVMLTDKTSMEVEATNDAVLLKILAREGEDVPVTLPIAIVGQTHEDIASMIEVASNKPSASGNIATRTVSPSTAEVLKNPAAGALKTGIKLSPRARKFLAENKLDIQGASIAGTGFQGGITQNDLEAFFSRKPDVLPAQTAEAEFDDQREILRIAPYSGIRKVIGDRLSRSQAVAPHVSFTTPVDCQELVVFRDKVNSAKPEKLSILDFIVAASSLALQRFPQVNASLQQDRIIYYRDVNIGVAVALEDGLIVPVVKNTQKMKLAEISAEIRSLAEKARLGLLAPQDYRGGTFTVSNLGMLDVEHFTSIINPPEAAILSVGAMRKTPVVIASGGEDRIVVRPLLHLTVTVDHRLIDGRDAVLFLSEVKRMLENPVSLFL